jgi:hypothetical protein
MRTLEKVKDEIDYIAFMVNEFALQHKLSIKESYNYLSSYGGVKFLDKHYEVEHCENPLITLDTLQRICSREGGYLSK